MKPSGDYAFAAPGSSSRSRLEPLDPAERGGLIRRQLLVRRDECLRALAVALVEGLESR